MVEQLTLNQRVAGSSPSRPIHAFTMQEPLFGGAFLVPEWPRTAIRTATVAFQEFPNHRVRGVLEGKPVLFEVVWFEVYSEQP